MEVLMAEQVNLVFHSKVIGGTAIKRLISRLIDHFGIDDLLTIRWDSVKLRLHPFSLGIDDFLTILSKGWLVQDVEFHIMSFSGVRGNASQVHQLLRKRGLMLDPQGQMIDLWFILHVHNGKIKFNENLVHPTRTRHRHPAFLCYIDLYVTIESGNITHNVPCIIDQMSIHFLSTGERDIYNLLVSNDQVRHKLFCFKPFDKNERRIPDYSIFNQIVWIDHCNFTHTVVLYDTTYLLAKRQRNKVIILFPFQSIQKRDKELMRNSILAYFDDPQYRTKSSGITKYRTIGINSIF
uniref:DNA-directed RNA polymerase n=1 Tax=Cajanus cajan TaxID=3821 RepID=A0A151R6M5_CAJCA|nr:DNA-directed RNA polymerase subunit beta'' [Cajanus cajan]